MFWKKLFRKKIIGKKDTIVLKDWELYVYEGEYTLSGDAEGHPELGIKGYLTHTADLVEARLEDDVLIYDTVDKIYHCPLKYMEREPFRIVIIEYRTELAKKAANPADCLEKVVAALAQLSLENDHIFAYSQGEFLKHVKELQKEARIESGEYDPAVDEAPDIFSLPGS